MLPLGGQTFQTFHYIGEFPVDLLRRTGFFVSLRFFQFSSQLGLAHFQFRDFFLQPVHVLLLRLAFARARLALLCLQAFLILPVPRGADSVMALRVGKRAGPASKGLLVGLFLFLGVFFDDLLRQVRRHLFVVREVHRERATAAGE